jgi:predicted DNA-binding transcriptional regulator YafY
MRSHSRGRRNEQVVRILEVLRDLSQSGGVDLYELADRFGTTVRTIRRDFDALAEAGLPLREEEGEGRRKRWAVAYRDSQRHLENLLGTGHYLALRIAMGQGGPARSVPSVFTALEDLIRERVWHSTQALRDLRSGGLELTFRCAASYEVTAWVASWRQGVEVVEPPALREELAGYGAWLQGTYAAPKRKRRD